MSKGSEICRVGYNHQKKILQQIYGAYQIPTNNYRRGNAISEDNTEAHAPSRLNPRYIL